MYLAETWNYTNYIQFTIVPRIIESTTQLKQKRIMEPGGESTQYESIRTVTVTPPKDKGQLGATQKSTISPLKTLSTDESEEQRNNNGEQAARDPTLSGPQTAGMTSGVSGEVDKDLKPDAERIDEEARRTRTAQRLGPGSGIGA